MFAGRTPTRGRLSVVLVTPPSHVDYAASVASILRGSEREVSVRRIDPREERLPSPDRFDAVVVTGSSASVADRDPWAERLGRYVRDRVAQRRPLLGVCFGHQLLADALGGRVGSLPSRRAGYLSVSLTDDGGSHPLFEGVSDEFVSFAWHRDRVVRPPDRATVLARNEAGVQAFAVGDAPAFGVQFHPEVTREMGERLVSNAGAAAVGGALSTFDADRLDRSRLSRQLYRNFVELAAARR
jgi:GMP synthase (glutamine-hydrolysing)